MKRAITVATVLVAPFLLGPLGPLGPLGAGSAGAAPPRIYHTIGSTSASATVTASQGCELTEVFVSSSKAMWAAIIAVNFVGPLAYFARGRKVVAQTPADA